MNDFFKFPEADIKFSHSQAEEVCFHQKDLIALFPYGLSIAPEGSRPFLLLKDESGSLTLPVALSPIEAGVTLSQANRAAAPSTPHRFTELLMQSLNIKPLQCVFVQVKGVHQYVRIFFSGHAQTNSLKLRADEAMSLCLSLGIPIFATLDFINRSKRMAAEIDDLSKGAKRNNQMMIRDHNYIM